MSNLSTHTTIPHNLFHHPPHITLSTPPSPHYLPHITFSTPPSLHYPFHTILSTPLFPTLPSPHHPPYTILPTLPILPPTYKLPNGATDVALFCCLPTLPTQVPKLFLHKSPPPTSDPTPPTPPPTERPPAPMLPC